MKVRDVVDAVLAAYDGPRREDTCDTLKAGSLDAEVHGVVVTFMATVEVVLKAAAAGADLIVTHEPTFYEHGDHPAWIDGSVLHAAKRGILEKYGISVWRCHDAVHSVDPDPIVHGLAARLGWEGRVSSVPYLGGRRRLPVADIDPMPLRDLDAHVRTALDLPRARLVGDPATVVRRVGLAIGGLSSDMGGDLAETMEKDGVDAMICGDVVEWTLVPYVRDSAALGRPRALLVVGHERTEEAGMAHVAATITARFPDLPVAHLEAGHPYFDFDPPAATPVAAPAADADRLARFEGALADLLADRADADRALAALRAEGRTETVRFRELLGRKLTDQHLQVLFRKHGIETGLGPGEGDGAR